MRIAGFALALTACVGTDTGNPPVIDFGHSGCHSDATDKGMHTGALDQAGPDPLYNGLTCMVWQRPQADTLQVKLINYEAGCHSDSGWEPRTQLDANGELALILHDSDCASASCGWCQYDVSFSVRIPSSMSDGVVHVYKEGCGDERRAIRSAWLPLSSSAEHAGTACDYALRYAVEDQNYGYDLPRTICNTKGERQPVSGCATGKTCTDLTPGLSYPDERCLAQCTSNSDCDSLSSCLDGVCKLSASGLRSW